MRLRRSTSLGLAALAALASAFGAFVYLQRSVLATSGLHGAYWTGTTWDGPPRLEIHREQISTALIRERAGHFGGPMSVEWRGFLIVPQTGRYRFAADVDDAVRIELDRRSVLSIATPGSATGTTQLNRGLHPLAIRYTDGGGEQKFTLYWGRESDALTGIPPAFLVPDIVSGEQVRLRRGLAWLTPIVPFCSSVALLCVAGVWGLRQFRSHLRPDGPASPFDAIVGILALLTFGTGLWWGLPDYEGWAPDELTPHATQSIVDMGFAQGWATIYPPFHFAVLALVTAPFHVLSALGVLVLDDVRGNTAMFVVQRAVSMSMALGIVAAAAAIGRIVSPRAGRFAALAAIANLPLAYYAKTANVDVPYVFWFMLSMTFYLRAQASGATRDFLMFVLCGTAAITTKDQAYGFFVLPAIDTAGTALWYSRAEGRPPGVPSMRVFLLMTGTAVAGLLVGYNVLLNWDGFVQHLVIITGAGSQPYRMYENSLAGHARMALDTLWQMGQAMSWPLFLASATAVAALWRAGVTPVRRLMLPLVSYYVTVIVVVGYNYDRFFLGPALLLAIALGWGVDRWLGRGARGARLRVAAVAVLFGYALLRVAALDTIMVRDSRYGAEEWLLQHAPPGARIAATGQYRPRRTKVFWTDMPQDVEELARRQPDFLVVNVGYSLRQEPGSRRTEFYQALSAGRTGYKLVFQHRTQPPWSPLNLEARFRNVREDPSSNLSKVNPLIEVYAR